MLNSIPFWARVAFLMLAMAGIAAVDWRRNGRRTKKWKEYGFVLLAGVLGAAFGFANDLITSSLSPDYFVFGKGIAEGPWFTLRASTVGIEAGFSAGAIAGAVCLFAGVGGRRLPPLGYPKLLGMLWRPVALAMIAAVVSAFCFRQYDPMNLAKQLQRFLDSDQMQRFLLVWWIHAGLYFGLLAGVVWIVVDVLRLRRRVT
ncbi:MAG: hypothetical protein ACOY3P_08325 [Planctomycetota bacterium]